MITRSGQLILVAGMLLIPLFPLAGAGEGEGEGARGEGVCLESLLRKKSATTEQYVLQFSNIFLFLFELFCGELHLCKLLKRDK
jgi:hypothetical protein